MSTFFIEGIPNEMQNDLENFNYGGPLSQQIKDQLLLIDKKQGLKDPYSYFGLICRLREKGFRIVAIDHTSSLDLTLAEFNTAVTRLREEHYNPNIFAEDIIKMAKNRLQLFNYNAIKMFKQEHEIVNGKFILFSGGRHSSNCLGFSGISEMLKCPSIYLEEKNDSNELSILNNFNFTEASPYQAISTKFNFALVGNGKVLNM